MTYWAILEKVKGSQLRLTKMDDEIYESFKEEFPDFDPAAKINEDMMKSKAGKEKWRNWVNKFEKKIEDFNFGTIIRNRADEEYEQHNTIFGKSFLPSSGNLRRYAGRPKLTCDEGVRMQFYAVEIAR